MKKTIEILDSLGRPECNTSRHRADYTRLENEQPKIDLTENDLTRCADQPNVLTLHFDYLIVTT